MRRGEERRGEEWSGENRTEQNRDCSKERSCLPYKAKEGGLTIWCVKAAVGFSVVAVTIATITDNDVKQETGRRPEGRRGTV